jgi:acetylornithine/N-succinyldiaminopimelate aminotransferase
MSSFEEIKNKSDKYLMQNYGRQQIAFTYGSGEMLHDTEGKTYIDFLSGVAVNTLGHCNADWVEALREQSDILVHTSNHFYIPEQADLAEMLVTNSLEDGRVLFVNSGTEAVETAFKIARRRGQILSEKNGLDSGSRHQIISLSRSFHGRTFASMNLTGQEKVYSGFGPRPGGFYYVEPNHAEQIETVIGPQTAAVIMELIQGEGGVFPLDVDYVQRVAELAAEHGALLIIDEVQTGIGRTGTMFAYEQYNITPDIITLAKGLGGGFPIGAVVAGGDAATVLQPGDHGSTFGGNHLACRIGQETIKSVIQNKLLEKVRDGQLVIEKYFRKFVSEFAFVQEFRGRGYLMGLVLEPGDYGKLPELARSHGLILNVTAGHIVRVIPPLNISTASLEKGLTALGDSLRDWQG